MNLLSSDIRVFHSIVHPSIHPFNKYLLSDNYELGSRKKNTHRPRVHGIYTRGEIFENIDEPKSSHLCLNIRP